MQTKEQRPKNKKQSFFSTKSIVFSLFSIFYSLSSNAQCAMCRASLESNGDSSQAEAVNDGIVYLMAIPYILMGVMGILIYRMYFKKSKSTN